MVATRRELIDAAFVAEMLRDARSMGEVQDRLAAASRARAAVAYGQRRDLDDRTIAKVFGLPVHVVRKLGRLELAAALREITADALDVLGRHGPLDRTALHDALILWSPMYRWFTSHGGKLDEITRRLVDRGAHVETGCYAVDEDHRRWRYRGIDEYVDEQIKSLGAMLAACFAELEDESRCVDAVALMRPSSISELDFTTALSNALDPLVRDVEDAARERSEPLGVHALVLAIEHSHRFALPTAADDRVDTSYLAHRALATAETAPRRYWTEVRSLAAQLRAFQLGMSIEQLATSLGVSSRAIRLALEDDDRDHLADIDAVKSLIASLARREIARLIDDGNAHDLDVLEFTLRDRCPAFKTFRLYYKAPFFPLARLLQKDRDVFDVQGTLVTVRPGAAPPEPAAERAIRVIATALGALRRSLREAEGCELRSAFAANPAAARPISRLVRWELSPIAGTIPARLIASARELLERTAADLAAAHPGDRLVETRVSIGYTRDPHHRKDPAHGG